MRDGQTDLLAPLEPAPEDVARPIGTIDGPPDWWDGFGAGLRVWCGRNGWRDFGDVVRPQQGGLMLHEGRLTIALSWDLGPAKIRQREAAEEAAADA